jgi:hypothetical protein
MLRSRLRPVLAPAATVALLLGAVACQPGDDAPSPDVDAPTDEGAETEDLDDMEPYN